MSDLLDEKIKSIEKQRGIKRAMNKFIKNYETCGVCGFRYRGAFKSYSGICEKCGNDNTKEFTPTAEICIKELKEITGYTFEKAKKLMKIVLYKLWGYQII